MYIVVQNHIIVFISLFLFLLLHLFSASNGNENEAKVLQAEYNNFIKVLKFHNKSQFASMNGLCAFCFSIIYFEWIEYISLYYSIGSKLVKVKNKQNKNIFNKGKWNQENIRRNLLN